MSTRRSAGPARQETIRQPDPAAPPLPYLLAQEAQRKALKPRKPRPARKPAADPRLSPTQERGLEAEAQARLYLQARGVIVFAANLRGKTGEIDLVCRDGGTLVFVEVRQRRSRACGGAAASVTRAKQVRIIRTAQCLLPGIVRQYLGGQPLPCRFDVIALESDGIQWLKQAFSL
ncbi:YraN family protein [Paracandidimonas soli]|uniref:UPF0102 protein EV686_101267 n=1 Tax=Paracandidimonas soli TaxID=1917182 RepID=A0A4V2VSL1_9BURK|nr:YraN family protein [Paracandidimonas soli]TCV02810.1 putative endonuclease [Paracandidimonas soli]